MEQGNVDLPILIGQSGPLNGLRWVIEREKLIGREDTCDVVIADRQFLATMPGFTWRMMVSISKIWRRRTEPTSTL